MTKQNERLRRPRPSRTGPIRDFSELLKHSPTDEEAQAKEQRFERSQHQPHNLGSAVSDSVKLGYSVIQDQIREGRRIAQQITGLADFPGGADKQVGQLFQRMLHFSTDFGALFADMMETVWQSSYGAGRPNGAGRPGPDMAPRMNGAGPSAGIAVEIESSRPTRVSVDLQPGTDGASLRIPGLLSLDGDAQPITGIRFAKTDTSAHSTLHIEIPDDQPSGTYSGVVVDGESGQPRGTLSIRVS